MAVGTRLVSGMRSVGSGFDRGYFGRELERSAGRGVERLKEVGQRNYRERP